MWMRDTENMSTYSSWTGSIVCRASDTSSPATILLGSPLLLPDNHWSRFHIDITISHALLLLSQTDEALQLWRCRYMNRILKLWKQVWPPPSDKFCVSAHSEAVTMENWSTDLQLKPRIFKRINSFVKKIFRKYYSPLTSNYLRHYN